RMMDLITPLPRPVPVKEIAIRVAAVPIPLNRFPQSRNTLIQVLLSCALSTEVLSRGQQPFHQKRCLDQVSAVVEHAENWHGVTRAAVHVMRPRAVIAVRVFEKANDLSHAFDALSTRDEAAIHPDYECGDAHTASASRNNTIVSRNIFAC